MKRDFSQSNWNDQLVDDCRALTRLAAREDLDQGYDWTTVALVPESSTGQADLVAREAGHAAGLAAIPVIIAELEAEIAWSPAITDGDQFGPQTRLGTLTGNVRDLLTTERIILNFVGRMCGIATLTGQYVAHTIGTAAHVYDTRKTCPGYRRLDKYSVHCGGGRNHRSGLYDAILIKDNHLAFGNTDATRHFTPGEAVQAAQEFVRTSIPANLAADMLIEIEVDSLEQLALVLPVAPDIVLLDNMTCEQLREAVQMRDTAGDPQIELEASGGVNLQTVAQIARTGVDRISVGALTHSARCLDIGLDWLI